MKQLSDNEYSVIGEKVLEAIGKGIYFSGSMVSYIGNESYRFTVSVIADRKDGAIINLIPVWWELHWVQDGKEVLTDFAFEKLNELLNNLKQE